MASADAETIQDDASNSRLPSPWSQWHWWLPYVGGLVAVLVFAGSLLTFLISVSRDVYRWLSWTERIEVITFSSMALQAFLNSGDGEVFLSHIDVRGEVLSQVINLNTVIKPNQFLTLPTTERTLNEWGNKTILTTDSEEQWQDIKKNKIGGFRDPSYVPVIYYAYSPELQLYKDRLGNRLRTFSAEVKQKRIINFSTPDAFVVRKVSQSGSA